MSDQPAQFPVIPTGVVARARKIGTIVYEGPYRRDLHPRRSDADGLPVTGGFAETSQQPLQNRGTAASVAEALTILKERHPEVALVSPHLAEGPLAGFDLVQEMRESFPRTRAIILLDSMEPRMVIYSFQVGFKGVFSRDRSVEALAKCLDVVHRGQIWAGTNELQIILQAMG